MPFGPRKLMDFLRRLITPTFVSYFLGTIFLAFAVVFFSYHLAYARRIVPGVRVVGLTLGNRTESEALGLLEARLLELSSAPLVFVVEGQEITKTLAEWGVDFEARASARRAYLWGREGTLWETTRDKFTAATQGVIIPPAAEVSSARLIENLVALQAAYARPGHEPSYQVVEDQLEIVPGVIGQAVDEARLQAEILTAAATLDFARRELPLVTLNSPVTVAGLEALKNQVTPLVFASLKLIFGSRSWVLTPEEVLALLDFSGDKLAVKKSAITEYVVDLAAEIDRPARGGTFKLENDRVLDFALPTAGYKLDEAKAESLLASAVLGQVVGPVELPVETLSPPAAAGNDYGIKTLLGTGVSDFSGSISGRAYNMGLASSKFDGLLIPPGEIFSFNQNLGSVESADGYQVAYIIKEGRTIWGVGGGVCQVATAMFRAALFSGLPILERTPHAYQVHYYEKPYGTGYDATVYSPSPDLKFKNDTPAYILIKRVFDPKTTTLNFEFYGTSDGRQTEVSKPVIHSQTRPPAPLYQEDPTLPKGTTKQIDWSAWGAKVTITRQVTRGGEVIQDDSFFSSYKPWQAVYLVGTKE